MLALEVKNIVKKVNDATGELLILKDISFNLGQAKTLAVTGSSGSGKSTLLGILAGLDELAQVLFT